MRDGLLGTRSKPCKESSVDLVAKAARLASMAAFLASAGFVATASFLVAAGLAATTVLSWPGLTYVYWGLASRPVPESYLGA